LTKTDHGEAKTAAIAFDGGVIKMLWGKSPEFARRHAGIFFKHAVKGI
jgi:hypothetical protein